MLLSENFFTMTYINIQFRKTSFINRARITEHPVKAEDTVIIDLEIRMEHRFSFKYLIFISLSLSLFLWWFMNTFRVGINYEFAISFTNWFSQYWSLWIKLNNSIVFHMHSLFFHLLVNRGKRYNHFGIHSIWPIVLFHIYGIFPIEYTV